MSSYSTLNELYFEKFKTLHAETQARGDAIPQETLIEILAAFDHLARTWTNDESICEDKQINRAEGHVKRACLDMYKLRLKEANTKYKDLIKTDISTIDNGDYKKRVIQLIAKIQNMASSARKLESLNKEDAFKTWEDIYDLIDEFEDLYQSDHVNWAKNVERKKFWQTVLISSLFGGVIGFVTKTLLTYLS